MNCWPDIKNKLHDLYNITLDSNVVVPKMDADLLAFLHLLKFVPVRRVKFENALNSFVVFSEVFYFWKNIVMHFFKSIVFSCVQNPNADPIELLQSNNLSPIIIAIIANHVPVPAAKYYIGWQDRVFSVRFLFK